MYSQLFWGFRVRNILHDLPLNLVFPFIPIAQLLYNGLHLAAVPRFEQHGTLAEHVFRSQIDQRVDFLLWLIRAVADIFEDRRDNAQFVARRLQFVGIERRLGSVVVSACEGFDSSTFALLDERAKNDAATMCRVPFLVILRNRFCNCFDLIANADRIIPRGLRLRWTIENWKRRLSRNFRLKWTCNGR